MESQSPITLLALRIRPDLKGVTGVGLASHVLTTATVLFAGPIAIFVLVALFLESSGGVILENALIFLALLLLGLWIGVNRYQIQIEMRPGVHATSGGSMLFILTLSAIFIFGPTAYWISILFLFANTAYSMMRDPSSMNRWSLFGTLSMTTATGTITILIGHLAYERMGGSYPLSSFALEELWPATVFLLIYWLLPFLISIPLIGYVLFRPEIVGDDAGSPYRRFFQIFISSSLSNIALPFTIFAAVLHAFNGPGVYLFFLAGVLLVSKLAASMTNNANQRAQRARELAALEEVGRRIINAPPKISALPAILEAQLPVMFFSGRIFIWLNPNRVLHQSENAHMPHIKQVQDSLQKSPDPYQSIPPGTADGDSSHSGLAIPIKNDDGEKLGGIYFDIHQTNGKPEEFIPALQALAALLASACYRTEAYAEAIKKERMSNELELAGRIQANFLPEFTPELPGYEIAASLTPALQTSGDFYDFIPLPEGRLGVLIADVADKGTGAALFMALTRTLIRTYALEHPDEPDVVFKLTNERVHEDTQSQLFITTFYGIIDPKEHSLTYVNGGHNPPYIFDPNNGAAPHELTLTGIPIGIFQDATWKYKSVPFNPGETLVMYTDGVTEAQNAAQTLFEETRLIEVCNANKNHTAQANHDAIISTIQDFVGDAPQFDDLTLLVIRRK